MSKTESKVPLDDGGLRRLDDVVGVEGALQDMTSAVGMFIKGDACLLECLCKGSHTPAVAHTSSVAESGGVFAGLRMTIGEAKGEESGEKKLLSPEEVKREDKYEAILSLGLRFSKAVNALEGFTRYARLGLNKDFVRLYFQEA
eukprot:comp63623_c0_seq1/m.47955 comp63623_c0_seq1/g.47955  ORF comp63623_c0_seq1/g.47955 comp63623_c0_seq1/m.47955 type:complete len:144 (+) comp63623_c0_seq1:1023-1454(+)